MSFRNLFLSSQDSSAPGARPREYILLPANPVWVALTLIAALLLNFSHSQALWIPDFLALTLIFWVLRQPEWIGFAAAFFFGILTDVQQGSLLGQHALAYVTLAFITDRFRKRLSWFTPAAQAVHLLPFLLITQFVVALIRNMAVRAWPDWEWFLASFVAAAIWPLWTWLLLIPQRRSKNDDTGL